MFAPNRLFLLSKPLRPLSRLSAGRHYQIPLFLLSLSRPFLPPFFSDLPSSFAVPHPPLLSSQSPLLSITEDVHLNKQSSFSPGRRRELPENGPLLCTTSLSCQALICAVNAVSLFGIHRYHLTCWVEYLPIPIQYSKSEMHGKPNLGNYLLGAKQIAKLLVTLLSTC